MAHMAQFDPYSVAAEVREQISSARRRIGFLTGAGTSMTVGLPGIVDLTNQVETLLAEPEKSYFRTIREEKLKHQMLSIF